MQSTNRNDLGAITLFAIARAAHLTGDRELERVARRDLKSRCCVVIRFNKVSDGNPVISESNGGSRRRSESVSDGPNKRAETKSRNH